MMLGFNLTVIELVQGNFCNCCMYGYDFVERGLLAEVPFHMERPGMRILILYACTYYIYS